MNPFQSLRDYEEFVYTSRCPKGLTVSANRVWQGHYAEGFWVMPVLVAYAVAFCVITQWALYAEEFCRSIR